jgi:dihydrofolate reductase
LLFAWAEDETTARAVHYDATGGVLSGRHAYDPVNGWGGDHHDGVPMFILTREPPDTVPDGKGTYTFVTEGVESAVARLV